jgi:hypothetical protein
MFKDKQGLIRKLAYICYYSVKDIITFKAL